MELLEAKHISSGYGKKQVLFDISFSVKQGEIVLLVGSNGSGKSTLLKTIYGFLNPKQFSNNSQIYFDGKDILGDSTDSMISKGLVYVPQKDNYFVNLDVQNNLMISGSTIQPTILDERLKEVYQTFPSLNNHKFDSPMKMSGGEKQLTTLGMAMMHRPKMLLLDEPTLNLSPTNSKIIFEKVKELNEKHKVTILIVEHKIKECLTIANRLIALKHGKVFGEYPVKPNFNHSQLKEILL